MTLLTQPAEQITRESLLAFLAEQIPESINLEYKAALTPRIVDSVAAMSNTHGGLILIGVGEHGGVPDVDPAGVELSDQSAIVNRCWTSLDPPFAPEVIPVLVDESAERYVLVIRVDRTRIDRPVLHDGRAKIRLHGRNATAGRQQLAALFAESASETGGRYLGSSGSYGSRNGHPLLTQEEEGLGVRVALSARTTAAGAQVLGTAVHESLESALYESPFESWLRSSTDVFHGRRGDIETWRRSGFNTSSVVTFEREPAKLIDEHYFLKAQCVLDAPHGPARGGLVTLLLGVAFQPTEQVVQTLGLEELYELTHILFATAVDVVGASVFPDVVGTGLWQSDGPHLHLDPGSSRTLADYIHFSGVRRPSSSRDLTAAALEVEYGENIRDVERRDIIIKAWLVKLLLDSGYSGPEQRVEALRRPALVSTSATSLAVRATGNTRRSRSV